MKTIRSILIVAWAMIATTGVAQAAPASQDRIEMYGTVRISADYIDVDAPGEEGGVGISSNTSVFGFRGALPVSPGYRALYQVEQTIYVDETGGDWATRDTFLGIGTPAGKILVGYMDTPYKYMGLVFSSYTTTAADPHAILGAASSGGSPRLDLRGRNAVQYRGDFAGHLFVRLMYSAGYVEDEYGRDDNDSDMYSGSLLWKVTDRFLIGAAYTAYSDWAGIGAEIEGTRLGARYGLGKWAAKAIFESTDSDLVETFRRDAYGLGIEYEIAAKTGLGIQWMHAQASDFGDDAADQFAVALTHRFNKRLSVHAVATTTRNDSNASYRITDYGHGDKVNTIAGGNPRAFSVGASLKF